MRMGPTLGANPQEPTMDLKPEAFRLMRDSDLCPEARAGTTVYSCLLGTYGLAAQDTRMTGAGIGASRSIQRAGIRSLPCPTLTFFAWGATMSADPDRA